MSAKYMDLKRWAGELQLPKGGFGMKKARLIKELIKAMNAQKDDLDENQLEWLSEQTGDAPAKKTKAKAKKTKAKGVVKVKAGGKKTKAKATAKKKVVKKVKTEKPAVEDDDSPTKVRVDASKEAVKSYAKELGIPIKGVKSDKDYNVLGQKVFAEVEKLEEDEREELSKDLFNFYSAIKDQLDEASVEPDPEEGVEEVPDDISLPKSKAKIKVWAGKMGISRKGKSNEEIAREILTDFQELEDEDKEDLPDALVEWANSIFEVAATEEDEDEDVIELPDFDTLKEYALAVGIKLKEIKKAKGDEATLAAMIVDVYSADEEDEYPEEVISFYKEVVETDDEEEVVEEEEEVVEEEEEVVEEEEEAPIAQWLGLCGYDTEDFADSSEEEMQEYLGQEYKDDPDQFASDELEDAVVYLRAAFPDMFKKKKKVVKRKK